MSRLSKKDEELNNTRVIHSKALWSMQVNLNVETKFKANSAKQKSKLEADVIKLVQTKKQLKVERDKMKSPLESSGIALKQSGKSQSLVQMEVHNVRNELEFQLSKKDQDLNSIFSLLSISLSSKVVFLV